jgi:CheY-like chemotaxis protein
MNESPTAAPRLLVVEDEYLIRMLLEDMLADLGYDVAAAVGSIAEASEVAANGDFSAAILDVNVGQARRALRVRHRLWRTQPARSL